MTPDVDVAVVGAGPVGLAAAAYARRSGLTVSVVEPRTDPVDKACGEGLMPSALAALLELGVDPPGHPITGITYLSADGRRSVGAAFRPGPGRGVRRTVLQAALAARAAALGATRVADRVVGLRPEAGGVHVSLAGGGSLLAGWVLAADGLHSPTRRGLGLDRRSGRRPRYGLRRHVAVEPWTDHVEVYWARHAEAYVTPVAAGCVGVALLGGRQAGSYPAMLAGFPGLAGRLGQAPWVGGVRGAGPLAQRATRRRAGRILLVGDAAGYVDALTGEGLAVGLASAREAVGCVARGRPEGYDARWRAVTRRSRWVTEAVLAAATTRGLRGLVVPAAAALPRGFAGAVDLLA